MQRDIVSTDKAPASPAYSQAVRAGGDGIFGVMIESHINPGRQDLVPGEQLTYGQSIWICPRVLR